jgi:anti-sigma-K factor RskA
MSTFSFAELRDMAPAYVLGALSEAEHSAFEQAMAASPELAQEVDAYRAVVTHIGSAQELTPPPAVRARFLDKISAQRSAQETAAAIPPVVPPTATPVEKPSLTVSTGGGMPVVHRSPEKPLHERGWLTGVIAVGLAASLLFAIQRNSQVTSLTAQLSQRDSILAARTVQLAQSDSTLNTLLEAGRNLVLVNLVTAPENGPSMQFFWNVKTGKGVIHAVGLQPADSGKIYQLWLIKDGKAVPSRTFNTGTNNTGLLSDIDLPTATTGVTAVAITVEPAGGSPQPTTTPFLVGEIPKALQ